MSRTFSPPSRSLPAFVFAMPATPQFFKQSQCRKIQGRSPSIGFVGAKLASLGKLQPRRGPSCHLQRLSIGPSLQPRLWDSNSKNVHAWKELPRAAIPAILMHSTATLPLSSDCWLLLSHTPSCEPSCSSAAVLRLASSSANILASFSWSILPGPALLRASPLPANRTIP
jgi:hypothetical protein